MALGSFSRSWWDIIVPIGISLINVVLSKKEQEARKAWENKRDEVNKQVDDCNEKIQDYLSKKNQNYSYHELISLHHSSFLAANEAHTLLVDANTSIDAIGKILIAAKEKRTAIENKLRETKGLIEKEKLYEDLKIIQDLRKNAFTENDKIKLQSKDLLAKVKHLNNQTRELKIMIRDNCGELGKNWYHNLTVRISEKRLRSL